MTLLKLKEKYQITVPSEVREKLNLQVGDYIEAEEKDGKIILTPKAVVDRKHKETWGKLEQFFLKICDKREDFPEEEVNEDVRNALNDLRGTESSNES